MRKLYLYFLISFILLGLVVVTSQAQQASAQQASECQSGGLGYSALVSSAQPENYTAYARFGKPGTRQASLEVQNLDGSCIAIGSAAITNTGWTKIGTLEVFTKL